jgi:hypothetical protein
MLQAFYQSLSYASDGSVAQLMPHRNMRGQISPAIYDAVHNINICPVSRGVKYIFVHRTNKECQGI